AARDGGRQRAAAGRGAGAAGGSARAGGGVSEEAAPEATSLVPARERSLVSAAGGLAARGLALASDLGTARVLVGPPGEVRCLRGHGDCVVSVAFSPDAGLAVSGSWDGTVRVWNVEDGAEVH